MNKPKGANAAPVHPHCYALAAYKPPSHFTAMEEVIFKHGTNDERLKVLNAVCIRRLGIPASIVASGDSNYSSAKLDAERFRRTHA